VCLCHSFCPQTFNIASAALQVDNFATKHFLNARSNFWKQNGFASHIPATNRSTPEKR